MRHVIPTMGTMASIELPDSDLLPQLVAIFDDVDERFSLYRHDSELSRIAAGELLLRDAGTVVRASYERAVHWRSLTGGLFTPERPDGILDLNGLVKAEAIERVGELLERTGQFAWSINVGGDILEAPGHDCPPVGIADPEDPSALLCSVHLTGSRRAIATSGSAQRGDHIWVGGSTAPAEFRQVTVIADDIVTADVLATAVVAGGTAALDDLTDRWEIDVLTVDRAGRMSATPGFRKALVADPVAAARC